MWLAEGMTMLGTAIGEHIVLAYGPSEFLTQLSDPFWFQALGCVMGMDWHSSGITTSVIGALKRGLNPRFSELGIAVCGGRGRHSVRTPDELRSLGMRTGLNGDELARTSRLTARVDNNAIGDGFQFDFMSRGLPARLPFLNWCLNNCGAPPRKLDCSMATPFVKVCRGDWGSVDRTGTKTFDGSASCVTC